VKLHAHQRAALDALYDCWSTGKHKNPLIVAPTGSGKSVMIGALVHEALTAYPGTRIVMATHVQELIAQNAERLLQIWPSAPLGLYSAGLKRRDVHSPVVFGGIQSMVGKEWDLQGADILIIDEAHLLSPNSNSSYQKFIAEMLKIRPTMKVVGFTATPYRLDSGSLMSGDSAIFDGVTYEITVGELLEKGFLSPLITYSTKTRLDVANVRKQGGEYVASALQAAIDTGDINARIVREAIALGERRGHWLAFCVGVGHAEHIRDLMRAGGISSEMVSGSTPAAERRRILADFKAGRVKCLTNADVLTTGFDAPLIDFLVMIRPTLSPGLYVQMLGRGMRTADGKANCLVADFAGNVFEHGPVDAVKPPREKGKSKGFGGPPPVKECPSCSFVVPVQQIQCQCGHMWPKDYFKKLQAEAAEAAFVGATEPPKWHIVTDVDYSRVRNAADTHDMLRVEYRLGFTHTASELVLIEHGSKQDVVAQWWSERSKTGIIPGTVQAALMITDDLIHPVRVLTQKNGKYLNVIAYDFGDNYGGNGA
jgi:DNA repair protein RadD